MFRILELVECVVVLGFVVRTAKAEEFSLFLQIQNIFNNTILYS